MAGGEAMIKILRVPVTILVLAMILSGCRVQTEPLEEVIITIPEESESVTQGETSTTGQEETSPAIEEEETITAPAPPVGTQVGNLAPDFALQDLDGKTVTLSELRGSPIALNFWATWCGWCMVEMPFLEEVYEEWSEKGLMMLAIDVGESSAQVQSFVESNNIALPVLLDTDGATAGEYAIRGYPTTYFLDKNGVIQDFKIGAFLDKASLEVYVRKIVP